MFRPQHISILLKCKSKTLLFHQLYALDYAIQHDKRAASAFSSDRNAPWGAI